MRKKLFKVIEFADISGVFDYPDHSPIPTKGDTVYLDHRVGIVSAIRHVTKGKITTIHITCSRYE